MAVSFKGAHFPPAVILMGGRWYLAYPLITRHVEELMEERRVKVDHGTAIMIRQVKYLNNIVEQDHHGVKRVTRPPLVFNSLDAAQSTLTGIELVHMLKKRQLDGEEVGGCSTAEQFYGLAA